MDEIKQYRAALDRVLLTASPTKLKAFTRQHRMPLPSSEASLEATMHKTITASRSLPLYYRKRSKAWLDARGLHSLDDGEVLLTFNDLGHIFSCPSLVNS
jgi:hypothetical protein